MEEVTMEQLMEEYPYFKKIAKYTLFVSKAEVDRLRNSEKIDIDSQKVSVEFLKKILNDDDCYEYISKYFNNEINRFEIAYIINGDVAGNLYYNRRTIIKGIQALSSQSGLKPQAKQRYNSLKDSISFEKFIEKYKNENYNINIDSKAYSIPVRELISFMQLPNEEFNNLCTNKEINDINGIPKEAFIYAVLRFFKDNKVLEEYLMPDSIIKRYMAINSFEKVDLQAINMHLTTKDTYYQKINIAADLEKAILDGLPKDGSDLEKAIYIYIKMCKLLTYDEEYYAVGQKGIATEKHKNVDFVSTITLENNKVVCFEFNLIYSKLLNQLGINFASDYKGMVGEAYGVGHANLEFRTGKFLIAADSVTSILEGDLARAKLNQPLIGLKCINKNKQTQQEFKESLTKMYQLIAKEDKSIEKYPVEHEQTLDELLAEYTHTTENLQDVGLNERLSILIEKVNSTKMRGIDSVSYVLKLRKILFSSEQRENNIRMTIVRNNEPFDQERMAMASVIFALNDKNFEENLEKTVYYYFNPNHKLIPITREELQARFNDGVLDYVEKDDPIIPGIIKRGGNKR